MKKIIKLTESDLTRIVKRVINERQYLNEDLSQVILLSLTLQYKLESGNIKKYSPTVLFSADVSSHGIKTIKQFSLFNQIDVSPSSQSLKGNIINGTLSLSDDQIKVLRPMINKGEQVQKSNMAIADQNTQYGVKPTIIEKQMPIQKESDLNRIVKRVMNERNLLMEESTNSPEIFIPYKKIKNQQGATVDVPATEAYAKSEYVTTFRILDSNRDTVKEITKNPSYLPYKLVSIELGGTAGEGTLRPNGAQKFVIGSDGSPYLTGTLVVGSAKPKLGIHTTGIVTKFSDTTTPRTGGVLIKKGKEYIPTQKESDLRRIVKNVMNERRYLMEAEDTSKLEPAITNWINAMNAVYGTQMKLGKSGNNVNITGGVRDIFLYALPLTFPNDKAKIYPRITSGFKTIKSDMAGEDPNKKLLFITCIPKLASSGGKVPQGCETVMKDTSIITKANAMNTAYDNLVRLVTPAQ